MVPKTVPKTVAQNRAQNCCPKCAQKANLILPKIENSLKSIHNFTILYFWAKSGLLFGHILGNSFGHLFGQVLGNSMALFDIFWANILPITPGCNFGFYSALHRLQF